MSTLLILGSKPEPVLPPRDGFDALACANASGRSAAGHELPTPLFTVISAIVTSGKQAPNRLALEALVGLRTQTLYFYPRPVRGGGRLGRAFHGLRSFRTSALYFRSRLRSLPYGFERFENPASSATTPCLPRCAIMSRSWWHRCAPSSPRAACWRWPSGSAGTTSSGMC